MITNHTQLLNWLIEKYKFKSYLELGVQSTKQNFDKIKARYKVGVDPAIKQVFNPGLVCTEKTKDYEVGDYMNWYELNNLTSDDFFSNEPRPRRAFDLIFIDGLHHADQVQRDFENSLKCLNEGGRIVIHDTLPENEQGTLVPRETKQWWGDVYKFAMQLGSIPGIRHYTVNMDNGCTVVWKDESKTEVGNLFKPVWASYCIFREPALNIIQPSEIETYL